jgi:hypothetical protein
VLGRRGRPRELLRPKEEAKLDDVEASDAQNRKRLTIRYHIDHLMTPGADNHVLRIVLALSFNSSIVNSHVIAW